MSPQRKHVHSGKPPGIMWASNSSELSKMTGAALGDEFSIPENNHTKTGQPLGRNVVKGTSLNNFTSFLLILKFLDSF